MYHQGPLLLPNAVCHLDTYITLPSASQRRQCQWESISTVGMNCWGLLTHVCKVIMYIWTVKHSLKVVAYLASFSPGYKACARLYLNGDGAGKDSHVSLYFALMKGRFDAILPWPFTHQVTMLLLDQSGQGCHVQEKFRPDRLSSSFQQPRSEMNVTTGCPRFISKTELERRKTLYMKENTMFIQIIVEWLDVISRISGHFVKYPIHACSQRFT